MGYDMDVPMVSPVSAQERERARQTVIAHAVSPADRDELLALLDLDPVDPSPSPPTSGTTRS